MLDSSSLPVPPQYFPLHNGRYDVVPGLFRINTAFGNGATDARLFQFDNQFAVYRANKEQCRAERLSKYLCVSDFPPAIAEAVVRLMIIRLITEYPAFFTLEMKSGGAGTLTCRLTGDTLEFDERMQLTAQSRDPSVPTRDPLSYVSAFDALCCQVQEDIAIVRRSTERGNWVAALHLCAPSHWAAEEKIGKDFTATHEPVPGFSRVAAAAGPMIDTVITRGPFVRFTWGITFGEQLNEHPDPPPGNLTAAERRRNFATNANPLYLRVERQVLWGVPTVDMFLFAIRVYLYPVATFCQNTERRTALLSALHSMSPEARRYKGIEDVFDAVVACITQGSTDG